MIDKLSRDDKKKILVKRASELAKRMEGITYDDQIQVVIFRLAAEKYALESTFIKEVFPLKAMTPLPCTPSFLLGLINRRGQIFSIVDLKVFFNLSKEKKNLKPHVILLYSQKMQLGILADSIVGTSSFPLHGIHDPPLTLTGIRKTFLKGVIDKNLVLLDAEKLLSHPSMLIHREVESS